jgi:hypothetical protein
LPGGDFVPEGFTHLSGSEWDSTVVEFEQAGKVDEMTLGSFGSEVTGSQLRTIQTGRRSLPLDLTSGTNVGLEHEVELDRGGELVAGSWISDIVLLDQFTKLGTAKVVNLLVS